ncbi:MAG: TIGR03943 family protein [Caloramator sp.]|nr:TIGR03943 family protein [Caloramator sp.]
MRVENILWAGILFLLFIIITILNFTGKIFYFLHPRLYVYSIFASLMLFILFLFEAFKLFKEEHHHHHKIRVLPYFMFLIFIFVVGTYEFENASQNIAQNKEANFTIPFRQTGGTIKDGKIEVNNKNYLDVMDELHRNIDKYEGREIKIDGFVFRDRSFSKNQFVVARMLITCCVADAQIIGLMVEGEYDVKENEWVRVEGGIKKGIYNGEIIPVITAKRVKSIEKPKDEYIYP